MASAWRAKMFVAAKPMRVIAAIVMRKPAPGTGIRSQPSIQWNAVHPM